MKNEKKFDKLVDEFIEWTRGENPLPPPGFEKRLNPLEDIILEDLEPETREEYCLFTGQVSGIDLTLVPPEDEDLN